MDCYPEGLDKLERWAHENPWGSTSLNATPGSGQSQVWELTGRRIHRGQPFQEGCGGAGGWESRCICHCVLIPESQLYPGMHQKHHGQQGKGGDCAPLLCSSFYHHVIPQFWCYQSCCVSCVCFIWAKKLCCFIFLNYPKCITWFMQTSLCNFWLMCFSFTEDFWLWSFHCMSLFFVLLGFVFPCNTLPTECLSGCQQDCFSCMVLCLAAVYLTDS